MTDEPSNPASADPVKDPLQFELFLLRGSRLEQEEVRIFSALFERYRAKFPGNKGIKGFTISAPADVDEALRLYQAARARVIFLSELTPGIQEFLSRIVEWCEGDALFLVWDSPLRDDAFAMVNYDRIGGAERCRASSPDAFAVDVNAYIARIQSARG